MRYNNLPFIFLSSIASFHLRLNYIVRQRHNEKNSFVFIKLWLKDYARSNLLFGNIFLLRIKKHHPSSFFLMIRLTFSFITIYEKKCEYSFFILE